VDKFIFSNCLNCGQMDIPFKYLDMNIGGNPRSLTFWMPIIDKIKFRLSVWKGKLISMTGRLCLIKSVFNFISLFYLSFFKALASVCKFKAPAGACKINTKIHAKFIWEWGCEGKKIACVAWDKVCSPVEEGGLGVKHVGKFNTTLFAKWLWRLGTEEEGVWRNIIVSWYDSWWEMMGSMSVRKASSWWRDLSKIDDSVD